MICDTIKQLRENAGYSQSVLAKKLNVTRSAVNAWEMGLSVPTTQYVVDMARLFRVSADYLLGLSTETTLVLDGLSEQEKNILYSLVDYFNQNRE
ncbi:MAG TPA: helix-turn-helix transcriptional regulator [Candidatus Avoscillospira stercorigallinarum]|uniref:Helix-turn-helix transcriptional regulator n=1 Tax=Candidatus Avoscillospira stercorigallinarum TaxID=2840708 RepID=A0A9D0Z573_9FIRM|nr:helix-turn-helix transcriptional regulator [Candidatus Avoscillospira stercorigallinarum]